MRTTRWHRATTTLARSATVALLAACAGESAFAPHADSGSLARVAAERSVELGACPQLAEPEGSVLAAHLYARGVQVYHWTGTAWAFDGPSAGLYADAAFTGQVGTHSAGPIWVHNGGGTVRGSAPVACPVPGDAIPWLLLRAAPEANAGVFNGVTAIQRVNTTGGRMPTAPGAPGEVREVPYTAEYYFYR